MAFFKFRWPGQQAANEQAPLRRTRAAQTESVEDMRMRARHRLIGAAVLVALGVIGLPLLFDTQPRPIPVDVPIEIPDRNAVAPLMVSGGTAPAASTEVRADEREEEEEVLSAPALQVPRPPEPARWLEAPVATSTPVPAPTAAPAAAPAAAVVPPAAPAVTATVVTPAPTPAPAPAITEAARARALLEGRPVAPAAAAVAAAPAAQTQSSRFIVQVGAFADTGKAQEVRNRLERSGIKTYAQVVQTKDGARTRVRVGPFEQRHEAERTAERIKGLGLAASVLTL